MVVLELFRPVVSAKNLEQMVGDGRIILFLLSSLRPKIDIKS